MGKGEPPTMLAALVPVLLIQTIWGLLAGLLARLLQRLRGVRS